MDSESVKELMALIETQSLHTLCTWAHEITETYADTAGKYGMRDRLEPCIALLGQKPIPKEEMKKAVRDLRGECKTAEDPVPLALMRAVSTAGAVVSTPSNALGFVLYGACAYAYDTGGMEIDAAEFDRLAEEHVSACLRRLKALAVSDEKHPVKVKWNC